MASRRNGRNAQHLAAGIGFTQVELLVVIGIIALLAAVLLPAVESAPRNGKSARTAAVQDRGGNRTARADSPAKVDSSQPAPVTTDVRATTSAMIPAELVQALQIAPENMPKLGHQTAGNPPGDTVAAAPPANDLCIAAIPVAVPSTTAGTTLGASADTGFPVCSGNSGIASPGVWYSVVGTGNTMAATTCDPATTFDTQLTVYCPSCATPVCVTANDDSCGVNGFQSSVSWCSQQGQTYFILVHGYDGTEFGPFLLSVADNRIPCSNPASCGTTCDVTCGPNQIMENEANCGLPNDIVNGGCNSTPNRFSPIACGQSYCGTAAFDGSTRDTDWYKLVLTAPTPVTWTISAEFDLLAGIVETGGVDSCAAVTGFRVYSLGPSCSTVSVSSVLPAGTWYLFVAPDFTVTVPCGKEYTATLTCGPPPVACCYATGECLDRTQSLCLETGGQPQDPGTSCNTPGVCLPKGACCADGCFETDRATCNSVGGPYLGDGTVCSPTMCLPNPPCQDCGPGPHWIDQCLGGFDLMPTGALVGISTNPNSCDPNLNSVMSGPVSIQRSNPLDVSINFPTVGINDRHLDVIDTEILSMQLTGGGMTLRAGAGMGVGAQIRPSLGAIHEGPVNTNADSFFDVFFEIQDNTTGLLVYNQEPLRVTADITCVPPDTTYFHPVGCVKLFTSPFPGAGIHIGNLTSANHSTYPKCGDPGTGPCNQPHDTPFCNVEACCTRVCELRPSCCTQAWDESCVAAAEVVCNPGACCLPQTCGQGGVCGQFEVCGGGATPCLCFKVSEGGGNCAADYQCATAATCPNGTNDCPTGQICYVNTCCGQPACGPANCPPTPAGAGSLPGNPIAGPTAAGGQGNVSGEIIVPTPGCIVTDRIRCADLGGTYNGNGTVCTPQTCGRAVEIDYFPNTTAVMELQSPNGGSVPIALAGPTTVHVFFEGPNEGDASDNDGNGLDEVRTELVDMQLTGNSPLGQVVVRLNPNILSQGQIEETANTQPGRLDLPPFAPSGTANSFFDVFFEITIQSPGGPVVLHTATPKRMSSVINHKPPAPGDTYENVEKIQLLDANGNPTGYSIGAGRHTPRPVVEVDTFPNTTAVMELQSPNGGSVPIALAGPTTVNVFFEGPNEGDANDNDGNGLDEVQTEIVDMQLTGNSPLGQVVVRLNPNIPSRGQIEETANTQPGRLDLPPFAPSGTANSFFDVFFEITIQSPGGPVVLHTATPKRMSSVINHKPPAPGDTYENVEKIQLLDANGNPTGYSIGAGRHTPRPPVEIDYFPNTTAVMELQSPTGGSVPIALAGPTTVHVFFEGPNEGDASDNDGNGLDEVQTEMVDMLLSGNSPLGPVVVRLNPNIPSRGQIEETANTQPGRLDLPPFAPSGTANSFFDVFFEITILSPGGPVVLHTATPKRMSSVINHKPPAPGDTYENLEKIQLLDANGNPTGYSIGAGRHIPTPVVLEACCLPNGTCDVTLPERCREAGGVPRGPNSQCLGDHNGNNIDDACEPEHPCESCGGFPHWIDQCPGGFDDMPTGALVGIDLSGDCLADVSAQLSGPVHIARTPSRDDSLFYPGLRAMDGHLDVIDTEIVAMELTGGGLTLRAGAGFGQGGILRPSRGAIAEDGVNPSLGHSFFDVFFEVDMGNGHFAYNWIPVRVEADVTCLPPQVTYIHVLACIPLYPTPFPNPLVGPVAFLAEARHGTYPTCGSDLAGDCFEPHDSTSCNKAECCECVCSVIPACCSVGWSADCAGLAREICVPPTVVKWESVLTHGQGVGDVALEIPDTGLFSEPRSAVRKLVVTFDRAIDPASAVADNVNLCGLKPGSTPGTFVNVDLSGIAITVNMVPGNTKMEINFNPGLPDYARYRITLKGLRGHCGPVNSGIGGLSRIFTALQDDANGDLRVNATDLGLVRGLVGTNPINPAILNQVRSDGNNDGRINATDLGGTRGKVGHDARAIPNPVCP